MNASTPQPKLPLQTFLEIVYVPLALRRRHPGHIEQFKAAIHWLAATIGRDARLGDFNVETMRVFVQRLANIGLAIVTARTVRKRIWQLWRYAHSIGYVEQPPATLRRPGVPKYGKHGASGLACVTIDGKRIYLGKWGTAESRALYAKKVAELFTAAAIDEAGSIIIPPESGPPPRTWAQQWPMPGSVLHYYRQTFRPELRPQLCAKDMARYDAAINHFHDFCQRHILLAEVTPDLLDQFRAWLDNLSLKPGQRTGYRGALRRIMRAADPERFVKRDGANPRTAVGPQERIERDVGRHGKRIGRRLPDLMSEPGTLARFLIDIYFRQAAPDCSATHRGNLIGDMRKILACFGRHLRLDELKRETIVEFRAWLYETGVSQVTVQNSIGRIKSVWRFAHELELAPAVPTFRRERLHREEPDSWTAEEVAKIVEATARLDKPPIGGIPAGRFWRALLLIAWYTALRRGSLVRIRVSDVDLAGWLYVPGSRMKAGIGKRFRLAKEVMDAIKEILQPERELLFPVDPVAGILSGHFNALLKLAGVEKGTRLANSLWHKIRRSVATEAALRAGVPAAAALLAHSSPGITIARYIDSSRLPHSDSTLFLPTLGELGAGDGGPST